MVDGKIYAKGRRKMLGTKVNKDLFKLIGQKVTLNDPSLGPVLVEVKDIVNGRVLYEAEVDATVGSIAVEIFEEIMEK